MRNEFFLVEENPSMIPIYNHFKPIYFSMQNVLNAILPVPEKSSPNIVFYGIFGQQNLGNECTLTTTIYHTKRFFPKASFSTICSDPLEAHDWHGIPGINMDAMSEFSNPVLTHENANILVKLFRRFYIEIRHCWKLYKKLRDCDLLVVAGGGVLHDDTTGILGYPFYIFKIAAIARWCRCKSLIICVGAGPVYHPLSKFFIKKALSYASYRSYRDNFSKDYLIKIGSRVHTDPVFPDLVFSIPKYILPAVTHSGDNKKIVGIGLIDYYGQGSNKTKNSEQFYQDFISTMGAFVVWLLKNRYTVQMIIGDIEYDTPVVDDLRIHLNAIHPSLDMKDFIVKGINSNEELLSQLAKIDVVISPRYHNIILAMILNKCVIALSYNEKFEALMELFGLQDFCRPIDELDTLWLIDKFNAIISHEKSMKKQIHQITCQNRQLLDKQYNHIFGGYVSTLSK
jgi:polysaccharide pyruvyl transferase WcaK-like protein